MWVKENSKSRLTKIPINNHQPRINTKPKKSTYTAINLRSMSIWMDDSWRRRKTESDQRKAPPLCTRSPTPQNKSTYVDWFERERERERDRERMNWIKVYFFNSNEQYSTLVNSNEVLFIRYFFVLVWGGWCIAQLRGFNYFFSQRLVYLVWWKCS